MSGQVSEESGAAERTAVRLIEIGEEQAGRRLDRFLMDVLTGVPRSRIQRIVRRGEVRVNGGRTAGERRLQAGDKVRVPPVRLELEPPPKRAGPQLLESIGAAIIQEDDRVLVLNKPSGIAVHGGSGVSFGVIEALRTLRPKEDLELVHRLDRDTSGCLLISKRRSALRILHELIREGGFEKRYLALQKGSWQFGEKRVDVPLQVDHRVGGERTVRAAKGGGKQSISIFKPVQFFGPAATLMEVGIQTGRTHQIRVHAAHVGHPVAGDEKYGDVDFNAAMREKGLGRMFLHAHSLGFEWPDGTPFSASAPLPPELGSVIDRLTDRRSSGKGESRPSQRGSKPKQRQANERARIARLDRLKQRDS